MGNGLFPRDHGFVHRNMMEIMGALNALHGRGGIQKKHSADIESTTALPRVYTPIRPQGNA